MESSENTGHPQSHFLRLPLEIRRQIYRPILTITPLVIVPGKRYPKGYRKNLPKRPSRLPLLLVNRQIHDEAAEILYGRNTYEIRVDLFDVEYPEPDFLGNGGAYGIKCRTPVEFESLSYICRVEPVESGSDTHYDVTGRSVQTYRHGRPIHYLQAASDAQECNKELLHFQNTKFFHFPPQTYRHLIRKIELKVREERSAPLKDFTLEPANLNLLLPVLWRLRTFDNLSTLTIKFTKPKSWYDMPRYSNQPYRCARMFETIYPLTRGNWKCTIHQTDYLKTNFPNLLSEVFAKCGTYPQFQEETLEETMRRLKVASYDCPPNNTSLDETNST